MELTSNVGIDSELRKVNILLVDDQPAKLLSYEAVLAGMGETLITASSATQAFECLLKNEIALILIDVCMPDLNGFELAGLIREHPRFQHIGIIFVSAIMVANIDQLRGYELGAVDYVPVPVVPELLRAKVKVFLDLYRKTRQLERLNAELQHRTREREAVSAQLFEARKLDSIGQLTGGVAHDFNNLLMAILGSLTLLQKRLPENTDHHRLLQNALEGARRGAALTQRLLAFSRRQELKPGSVDIARLVGGMEDLLKRALGPTIEIEFEFPSRLPPVLVDANQLELALLNIAMNARDAMPKGGTLSISASQETRAGIGPDSPLAPGDYVRIVLVDSGTGMDAITLARATEPFFTTKGPGRGTGLGLSTVHGLAAQSGGQLRISSLPNIGTTVELYLPQANVAATDEKVETSEPVPTSKHCRVLIVDDDSIVMTSAAALIEDLGHTSIEARSGADALAKLAAGLDVDVVITDHIMPTMTGLELARCLQEHYPKLPVILATGSAESPFDPDLKDLFRLTKPCSQQEIAIAINTAVNHHDRN